MFVTEAFAQTAGGGSGSDMLIQFLPIVLIFVIMYFLILRPQRTRAAPASGDGRQRAPRRHGGDLAAA